MGRVWFSSIQVGSRWPTMCTWALPPCAPSCSDSPLRCSSGAWASSCAPRVRGGASRGCRSSESECSVPRCRAARPKLTPVSQFLAAHASPTLPPAWPFEAISLNQSAGDFTSVRGAQVVRNVAPPATYGDTGRRMHLRSTEVTRSVSGSNNASWTVDLRGELAFPAAPLDSVLTSFQLPAGFAGGTAVRPSGTPGVVRVECERPVTGVLTVFARQCGAAI